MDGDAPSRLVVLVERITNKRNPALDTSLLAEIKALCKIGDEHVLLAFDAVYSQLRATHAQVRRGRLRTTGLAARHTPFLQCSSNSILFVS